MARNTLSRSLHDLGLAAWFGGTLANAVALNPAAGEAGRGTGRVANEGWDRWTPVNAVAIGAHLVGSIGQIGANKSRIARQRGVKTMSGLKTLLTVAALGATAYSRALGAKLDATGNYSARSGTRPKKLTKRELAETMDQLDTLQWVIPALTGALVVVSSYAGEQQRPSEVLAGITRT